MKTTSILYIAEEFGHSSAAKDQNPCSALQSNFKKLQNDQTPQLD